MFVALVVIVSVPILWLGYGHWLVRRFQAHYLEHGTCIECGSDSMRLDLERTVPGDPDAYYSCEGCGAELYLDESCARRNERRARADCRPGTASR